MSGWKPGSSLKVTILRDLMRPLILVLLLAAGGVLPAQEELIPPENGPGTSPLRVPASPAQRLEWALENNDVALTARILRDFPDLVQGPLPSGGSPLGTAVSRGSWEALDFLLEKGAGLQGRDSLGNQALLSAYLNGQTVLARKLRQRGADLQSEDAFGNTALHLLNKFPANLWFSLLVEGFDLEARNYLGQTPFLRAVWEGNLTVADLLAKEGANTRETDWLGRSAGDYARRMGDEAMVLYLDSLP